MSCLAVLVARRRRSPRRTRPRRLLVDRGRPPARPGGVLEAPLSASLTACSPAGTGSSASARSRISASDQPSSAAKSWNAEPPADPCDRARLVLGRLLGRRASLRRGASAAAAPTADSESPARALARQLGVEGSAGRRPRERSHSRRRPGHVRAARGAERLVLEPLKLGVGGAAPALQLEVLANRFVEDSHVSVRKRLAQSWAPSGLSRKAADTPHCSAFVRACRSYVRRSTGCPARGIRCGPRERTRCDSFRCASPRTAPRRPRRSALPRRRGARAWRPPRRSR